MGKVLMIDDNIYVQRLMIERLKKHVKSIVTVNSVAKAIKHLKKEKMDIILLDLNKPEHDGIGILNSIKSAFLRPPPIILITGHGTLHLVTEFLKNGCIDFIQKPIDFEILLLKIKRAIKNEVRNNLIIELEKEKTELSILLNASAALNHEINNPLNTIFNAIGLIKGQEEDNLYLQNIKDSMNRIKEVVKDFSNIKFIRMKPYISGIEILDIKSSVKLEE
ncbi:MAG: response regulator [Nitrospirae bacterium]|nr:response regulator [Nitrospirota bacterium]MBF0539889.1 response regulator [Nitrospirota bacterium]